MNFVLAIYTEKIYREIFLPELDNSDYHLHMRSADFALRDDVLLSMEVIDGQWCFTDDNICQILCEGSSFIDKKLCSGQILRVITVQNETVAIMVWEKSGQIAAYPKYAVMGAKSIRIGRGADNDISCGSLQIVSGYHAEILFRADGACIQDLSSNGTYLGNHRITEKKELRFGDVINIFGLTIIYLDDILAINSLSGDAVVRSDYLFAIDDAEWEAPEETSVVPVSAETIIHIAPRSIPAIHEEPEHIENIPPKKEVDKKPAWMSVLPSLTMVLPMALGFLLMGNGMGTGIIIAAGSATVGFTWAVINLNHTRKTQRQQELLRLNKYGEYLVQCADRLREKFEHNRSVRLQMYPPAETCAGYTDRSPELWNRTKNHSDFLYVRFGLGSMPFQVKITAPKREFSLVEDELAERPGKIAKSFQTMDQVPVGVDLIKSGVVGLLSSSAKNRENLMQLLVAQVAANHCYTDVKLVFLYDAGGKNASMWNFAKWLPHVWNEERSMRYIASNPNEKNDVLYALGQVLRTRSERVQQGTGKKQRMLPHYVLVVEDPSLLDDQPISKFLYESEPGALGVSTVLMAQQYTDLPSACQLVVSDEKDFAGMFGVGEMDTSRTPIDFDTISSDRVFAMAKRMASMRVKELESSSNIPNSLTFFEMMQVQSLEELQVMDHWRKNRTYESMRAMVGYKAGNVPCYLDIYEKVHGPHGLVAGTTGSGKSETLQTYILSLACAFSPQDVGFFIIDFKGGGMANLFSNLPHMMGQISNLSGNQVRRAMVSIKSENARRMRLFGEYGVNKIDDYVKLYKNQEAPLPLPHLLIIIDEFAELKREEPEFMKELISVAQVGRSLGVHLILATQKPSGTVDDNIWSNSKFKLCLRVADKQDSNDMLHKPDAAYLTRAGRCYLQVGNDEVFELFQSGWSGAVYDPNGEANQSGVVLLDLQGRRAVVGNRAKSRRKILATQNWMKEVVVCTQTAKMHRQAGASSDEIAHEIIAMLNKNEERYPDSTFNVKRIEDVLNLWPGHLSDPEEIALYLIEQFRSTGRKLPEPKEQTQLDAVVDYLADVAQKHGLQNQQKLWMPVLPETLYLEDLDGFRNVCVQNGVWNRRGEGYELSAHLGLVDAPEVQRQFPLIVDFAQNGHLAIAGGVTCGKSTLMQTLFYSLICRYSPEDLNLYLIDFSSQMLAPFEKAPHVGGVVLEGEDERLNKLFGLLSNILKERKQQIRGGSFSQYIQMHGHTLPAIVVGLDGYANFREKTDNRFEANLMELLRDAEGYGIYVVISCGGYGGMELQSKLADKMRQGICLEMGDKFKYAEILHMTRFDVLPEANTKGRGLAMVDDNILEYQTALAVNAENDYRRAESIDRFCDSLRTTWAGKTARRIPEIPKKPTWALFTQTEEYAAAKQDPALLPVAYRQEDASVYSIDFSKAFCYLALGQEQSGKSVFLRNAACAAADKGARMYIIDRSDESEKTTVEMTGATKVSTDRELFEAIRELITITNERGAFRKELQQKGLEDEEIFARMQKYPPIYYFVADMNDFMQRIYTNLAGIGQLSSWFEVIFAKGKNLNVFFVGAANIQQVPVLNTRQAFQAFIRDHRGVLLGGCLNKQSVFSYQNIRSYNEQGKLLRVGQAYAVCPADAQEVEKIVIPQNRGGVSP